MTVKMKVLNFSWHSEKPCYKVQRFWYKKTTYDNPSEKQTQFSNVFWLLQSTDGIGFFARNGNFSLVYNWAKVFCFAIEEAFHQLQVQDGIRTIDIESMETREVIWNWLGECNYIVKLEKSKRALVCRLSNVHCTLEPAWCGFRPNRIQQNLDSL